MVYSFLQEHWIYLLVGIVILITLVYRKRLVEGFQALTAEELDAFNDVKYCPNLLQHLKVLESQHSIYASGLESENMKTTQIAIDSIKDKMKKMGCNDENSAPVDIKIEPPSNMDLNSIMKNALK